MEEIEFSKEEKRELKETLNVVLNDLENLWQLAETTKFTQYFRTSTNLFYVLVIVINENGIKLGTTANSNNYLRRFKKNRSNCKIQDFNHVYYFLQNYEKIRSKLEDEIKSTSSEKSKGMQQITELRHKYDKEAVVEINFPQTINQQVIEVKKEDNRTIGEIKMGYGTIKIVTQGEIVLSSPKETPKVKKIGGKNGKNSIK